MLGICDRIGIHFDQESRYLAMVKTENVKRAPSPNRRMSKACMPLLPWLGAMTRGLPCLIWKAVKSRKWAKMFCRGFWELISPKRWAQVSGPLHYITYWGPVLWRGLQGAQVRNFTRVGTQSQGKFREIIGMNKGVSIPDCRQWSHNRLPWGNFTQSSE